MMANFGKPLFGGGGTTGTAGAGGFWSVGGMFAGIGWGVFSGGILTFGTWPSLDGIISS